MNLKIGFVSHVHLDRDSFSKSIVEIVEELNRIGNKTDLIVPSISSRKNIQCDYKIYLPSLNINFLSSILFSISVFFYLPVYILRNKPNVIILDSSSMISSIIWILISKLKIIKTKWIFDVRSIPVENKGLHGGLFNLQYILSIFSAKFLTDSISFLTLIMAKEECKKFGIKNKPIGVWTSGVNEKLFNPILYAKEGGKLKRRLGLEKKFVVFYHGVLSPNRGLQNAVRAINLLKKDYPNIVLFFLGEGQAKNELKEIVKENKSQDNVIFHNGIKYNEVPKYVSMMDIGIVPLPHHPYWNNQSPLKVMEYLAMEKPIILTDIPAHKDIIGKATKCGIFIKSHEPEEIARGILWAYNNKQKLKSIGKEGRKIILEKYTWKKIAKDLEVFLVRVKNG